MIQFHISRRARDRYQFDDRLFALAGNVVLANFHSARVFAQHINDRRDVSAFPEQAVSPGDINALGLIDEMLHLVVRQYRAQAGEDVLQRALDTAVAQLGPQRVDQVLRRFVDQFPPVEVYRRQATVEQHLAGTTEGRSNREVALEEMMMLWVANQNPAFEPFRELFDDAPLRQDPAYPQLLDNLHDFFDQQAVAHGGVPASREERTRPEALSAGNLARHNLLLLLRAPALAAPHSLTAQLEFMQQQWSPILGRALYRLLSGLDLMREEARYFEAIAAQAGGHGPGGPGPAEVIDFAGQEAEPEQFSADLDWMPSLVLVAKNSYVWLDQLSRQYGREIRRLDDIPDAELATLAARGFTGLWFIGIWERSPASERIKRMMGNADAVASAYSLSSYHIAADLGGDAAFETLKARAWQYGLRMASDMVPNHMGIDSPWVMEHPDWFIQRDDPPYPAYTFNGPDLSWNPDVGIYLEDHYFDRSDAAVVFKRVDHRTGEVKYVYHGNDGTTIPWNDTAQLNYLHPDVREAAIQTILDVARRFPVIRFDAAMTLAKKHYARLWYPEPGTGGSIPSRAEFAMSRAEFDAAMPLEFWREVVDRVAQEAPDTLLLAEAFWLMEGYFVRTLGMHRVYNSAFMNMLRDEDNAKYRQIMKNTLEFDPEILKRYVNFMNNPDERTAVDQFGKGDKYFGVATLMATMPGLPMFGHGQVEGFTEKYGMEFRRPLWEENPDPYLVERHMRELAPLLHQRPLFAEVENFRMYDFFTGDGHVVEDVFAYSNRLGDQRALVVYHNKFAEVKGWLKTSAPYMDKSQADRPLTRQDLAEGLALGADTSLFTVFRDTMSGLEYIRSNQDLHQKGLYVELGAYRYHVFQDFREVQDTAEQPYGQLALQLGGRGVPSIEEALRELVLLPVLNPFSALVNADVFRRLIDGLAPVVDGGSVSERKAEESTKRHEETRREGTEGEQQAVGGTQQAVSGQASALPTLPSLLDEVEAKVAALLTEVQGFEGGTGDPAVIAAEIRRELEALAAIPHLAERLPAPGVADYPAAAAYLRAGLDHDPEAWGAVLAWIFTHSLGKVVADEGFEEQSRAWLDEWRLGRLITQTLEALGVESGAARRAMAAVRVFVAHQASFDITLDPSHQAYQVLAAWLKDHDIQQLLQVHRFQNALWFNQEAFERLVWGMLLRTAIGLTAQPGRPPEKIARALATRYRIVEQMRRAEAQSGYQVEKLLAAVRPAVDGGPKAEAVERGA